MNNSIKLYVLKIPQDIKQDLFDTLLKCVDATKRERILKYRNKKDATATLMGDLMVRYLAGNIISVGKEDFAYGYNNNKKPYLIGCDAFKFNISHSGQYVAVAAGPFEVGCDIQKYQNNIRGVEQIVFSDSEQKLIKTDQDLFRIWTLKESFLKAIGEGFTKDVKNYTVVDKKGAVRIIYKNREYNFCEYNEFENYAVAVCANGNIDMKMNMIEFEEIIGDKVMVC